MPDEDRVFDVSKPGKSNPSATSKPIIVGHRPTMADPMMRTDTGQDITDEASAAATRINVTDTPPDSSNGMTEPAPAGPAVEGLAHSSWNGAIEDNQGSSDVAPAIGSVAAGTEAVQPAPGSVENSDPLPSPPADDVLIADEQSAPGKIEPASHVEALHVAEPKRKKSPLLLFLVSLLVLIIAAYLIIDAGVVKTSIKLPFHVFKQDTQAPAAASTASTPAVPTGFTVYKIATTNINFAAPTAWGEPTSTTDPGYSKRSADAKSDGAHAFIVDFATNKDVQVTITSAKYLPAARAVQYYDFLQWCTGTSDDKTYLGALQFTSADKVDTATTVSCTQGPITDATKLDSTTIVELNSKDSAGASFGDLYTKNTKDKEFVVFRVKDKSMKNSADIKKLLNTVKSSAI